MKNMHIYMLPASAGAFALLFSPIAETAGVAYGLAAFIVVAAGVGLHSLAKSKEAASAHEQLVIKQLEGLNAKIEQMASKQEILLEEQKNDQKAMLGAVQGQQAAVKEALGEHTASTAAQLEQQTTTLSKAVEMVQKVMLATEDKIDDGNKVFENVSVLMMKELQMLNKQIDELIGLQSSLPNDLSNMQDAITRNQEDLVDGLRNIEQQIEAVHSATASQYEQLTVSHQEVVEKIADEFTTISTAMQNEMQALQQQAEKTAESSEVQLAKANEVVGNIQSISTELKKLNNMNHEKVEKQIEQLVEISGALLNGVSQLTNSQSTERKQLLMIQKNLISKFSK